MQLRGGSSKQWVGRPLPLDSDDVCSVVVHLHKDRWKYLAKPNGFQLQIRPPTIEGDSLSTRKL
jgi:hypothetical protein